MIRSRALVPSLLLLCATSALASGAALGAPDAPPPRIQVAILLDTSNSMDGLIDQARNQLWQVVGAFAGARRGNAAPTSTAAT